MSTPTTPTSIKIKQQIYNSIHFYQNVGVVYFFLFSTPLRHVENLKFSLHLWVAERWRRSGGEKFEMLKTLLFTYSNE